MSDQGHSHTPTRRDFLKVATLGVGAVVEGRLFKPSPEGESTKEITDIERVIKDELDLSPEEVELIFTFDNHVVTEKHYNEIEAGNYNCLIGELNMYNLDVTYLMPDSSNKPNMFEDIVNWVEFAKLRIFNTGLGASPTEIETHNKLLVELLNDKRKFTIVATDVGNDITAMYKDKIIPPGLDTIFSTALFGSMAFVFAKNLLQRFEGAIDTKELFKRAGLPLTALAAWSSTATNYQKFLTDKGWQDLQPFLKIMSNLEKKYYDAVTPIVNPEASITFYDVLLDFRNLVMALNTWNYLATNLNKDSNGKIKKQKIMFFAGAGHTQVKNYFLLGPRFIQNQLRTYAENMIATGLKTAAVNKITVSDASEKIWSYLKLFSEPVSISNEYNESHSVNDEISIPNAPNTIAYKSILDLIRNLRLRKEKSEEDLYALEVMLKVKSKMEGNVREINNYNRFNQYTLLYYEDPNAAQETTEIYRYPVDTTSDMVPFKFRISYIIESSLDSLLHGNRKDKTIELYGSKNFGVLVAYIPYKGRITPVYRIHRVSDDCQTLYVTDVAFLNNGESIPIRKIKYKLVRREDVNMANTDTTLVAYIASNDYGAVPQEISYGDKRKMQEYLGINYGLPDTPPDGVYMPVEQELDRHKFGDSDLIIIRDLAKG